MPPTNRREALPNFANLASNRDRQGNLAVDLVMSRRLNALRRVSKVLAVELFVLIHLNFK